MIRRSSHKGGALMEYGFLSVLVVVGTMGMTYLMSDNLNYALLGLRGEMGQSVNTAEQAAVLKAKKGAFWQQNWHKVLAAENAKKKAEIPPPSQNEKQICYESGWCVNVPTNAQVSSATTGSIGNQRALEYAKIIAQIDAQMKGMKELENTQLRKLISELAKKGENLAQTQENLLNNCPAGSTCVDASGTTELVLDVNLQSFTSLKQQLSDYLQRHPEKLPPEIVALLTENSEEIVEITENYQKDKILTLDDVNKTYTNASNICTQGDASQCDASKAKLNDFLKSDASSDKPAQDNSAKYKDTGGLSVDEKEAKARAEYQKKYKS